MAGEATQSMVVRVGDPARLVELVAHLTASGCAVDVVDDETLSVDMPDVPRADAAELELDLYLRLWEVRVGVSADRISG